jgi:citrate lyase subunit beta/citryl-CoA lyase
VPAANARAVDKSLELDADCLVYDLEDSVGPDAKDEARERVIRILSAPGRPSQQRIVRINGLDSDWLEQDSVALRQVGAQKVLLPKIRRAEDILRFRELLGRTEEAGPAFWIMVETASCISQLPGILAADEAIEVIMMGLEDLAVETGIQNRPGRQGLLYALQFCVLTARAHDLGVIDGVFTAFLDEAGFEAECRQALELGFDGKSLIHPNQLDTCNRCFSPDDAAVREAREILQAWKDHQLRGQSVAVVDGRMIEHLHVNQARRILARAETDKTDG